MGGLTLVIVGLVGLAILLEWPVIWLILAFIAAMWLWQALRPAPRR